jgi:hypothetical protein
VIILGTFLPWVTGSGVSLNGWDLADLNEQLGEEGSDAPLFVGLGVILAAFGIVLAVAGRLLAVAILALVVAALTVLAAAIDVFDDGGLEFLGLQIGAGLWIILVAAIAALAGSIWAVAVRRDRR